MTEDQNTNGKKQQKLSPTTRFVGAVVFSLGFTLFQVWLDKEVPAKPDNRVPDPSSVGGSDE